jgi:ABC-type lipoprotein export system ATPase subunit
MIPDPFMDLSMPVASADRVRRVFHVRGDDVVALDDVSVEVAPGRLLAVAGPSGSGKSTLLAMFGCLDRPSVGTVRLDGRQVDSLSRRTRRAIRRTTVATVLPQPSDNLFVNRTGFENLERSMRHRGLHPGDDSIDAVMAAIDLQGFMERDASTMSGGEQQRLALACALVCGMRLVLADEPTGALDDANARQVVTALRHAVDHGATIVVATHDDAVIEAADDVVHLAHGRRVE